MSKKIKTIRISYTAKFAPKKTVVFTNVENKGIIFNLNDNTFYSLNETAAKIWSLLQNGKNVKEIAGIILREYHYENDKILRNIKKQIRKFLDNNLIELI